VPSRRSTPRVGAEHQQEIAAIEIGDRDRVRVSNKTPHATCFGIWSTVLAENVRVPMLTGRTYKAPQVARSIAR
jgi:hypothetical protein